MFDYVNGNLPAAFDHSWNENWHVNENRYVLKMQMISIFLVYDINT
jgi:hypothetical protein